jgi:hypothetical protein
MNGWITTPIDDGLVRGAVELAADTGNSGTCPAAFGQTSA